MIEPRDDDDALESATSSSFDVVVQELKALSAAVDSDDLEPVPDRGDWASQRRRIEDLQLRWETTVAPSIEAATFQADVETRETVLVDAALVGAEIAALQTLAGAESAALGLLRRASGVAPEGPIRSELEAALRSPREHVPLVRARWHHRRGDFKTGDSILRRATEVREPGLVAAKRAILNGLRPITSAPALFRVNGDGTGLYGSRDRWADGSYVTTYCICVVFIPVFPLAAYRVIEQGDGMYTCLGRAPLSPFARGAQLTLLAALALGLVGGSISGYLSSPSYLASQAMAEARALEDEGRREEALAAYERALAAHGASLASTEQAAAGASVAHLLFDPLEPPLTLDGAGAALRTITRFANLPSVARGAEAIDVAAAKIVALAGSLDRSRAGNLAALRLGDALARLARAEPIEALRRERHRALADESADAWPAEAIEHWVSAEDDGSLARAATSLGRIVAEPSLLADQLEPAVARLTELDARLSAEHREVMRSVQEALAVGRSFSDREGRADALASEEPAALQAQLATEPRDQEVRAALAEVQRASGDSEGARALVAGVASPGLMIERLRRVHATLLADAGQVEEAAAILSRDVERRLPAFSEAVAQLNEVARAFDQRIGAARLRRPAAPAAAEAGAGDRAGRGRAHRSRVGDGASSERPAAVRGARRLRARGDAGPDGPHARAAGAGPGQPDRWRGP